LFGFSFTLLRIIGVISGVLGIVIMYHILMQIQDSMKVATIGSLLFAMNPIFLNGANSFHTDVPTTLFMLLSFFWFIRFFHSHSISSYAFGVLFAIIACTIKQTSLSIGLAFFIYFFITSQRNIRNVIIAMLPLFLMGSLIYFYHIAITSYNLDLPGAFIQKGLNDIFLGKLFNVDFGVLKRTGYHIINTALSLGIFASPIILPFTIKSFFNTKIKASNIVQLAIGFLFIALFVLIKIYFRSKQGVMGGGIWYMPFVGSNIYDFGVGPLLVTGIQQNEVPGAFKAGIYLWFIVSIIGAISFISFLNIIIRLKRSLLTPIVLSGKIISLPFFPLLIMLISFIPYLFLYPHAKYLTLYFPFMIITIISALNIIREKSYFSCQISFKTLIACIIPIIMFGVMGERDYMSFNRTKWDALNYLTETEKIPVAKIDGGFEFNEWHLSHLYTWKMTDDPSKDGRFWPVVDDEYIVTVTEIEGYDVYKEFKYNKWLPPAEHRIKVLRRISRHKSSCDAL
jgi:hypothetical protein